MFHTLTPLFRCASALATMIASTALVLSAANAAPIKTEHVEVELLAAQTAVVPGQSTRLGLSIKHAPHWHTYWKNPGDSGYPTKVTWTLPPGYAMSEFSWPVPQRLATGPIVNFGYEGEVLLLMDLRAPQNATPGTSIAVRGKAEWLVCKEVCIPEEGEIALTLPVAASTTPSASKARFDAANEAVPTLLTDWRGEARIHGRDLWIELTPAADAAKLTAFDVFPEAEQITEPAVQKTYSSGNRYGAMLKLVDGANVPAQFQLVVKSTQILRADKKFGFISINTKKSDVAEDIRAFTLLADASTSMSLGGVSSPSTATQSSAVADSSNAMTLWAAVLFAFVGGMLLNLMPCVFPVLSLKILSFAQHAHSTSPASSTGEATRGNVHSINERLNRGAGTAHANAENATQRRGAMRAHGLFYAAGVVLSFLALAGVLLALKSAGSAIGWGFQLQNPSVVWVLAVIFFLIGLNLMGTFEVGTFAPSALLNFTAKNPGVDAFFSGVLAVLAASPCTAPFMGAALGFALTQSALAALTVFAALGIGMALPYVALAWFPRWLDRLPRPGKWMITFKQALAFPMFLTVVWLIWVIAQQATIDGAAIALVGLVGIAFGAWLLGGVSAGSRIAGALALVFAVALAWPSAALPEPQSAQAGAARSQWKPWNPEEIAALNAQGKAVFVDFTAAWCVSCQANKRLVLTRAEVEKAFAAKNVVLMRADWTNRDERITNALKQMNRSGVPVYALHAPGKPVELLPELLTTGIVIDALSKL